MARKITRATLDELVKEMPPLTEQEQRGCVGGGSGTINDPYSESELDYMLKSYSWSGGYVFFNGTTTYVADDAVIYGEGGRSGLEDFYSLINSYVGGAADGISSLQQGQYGQVTSRFARYGGGAATALDVAVLLSKGYANDYDWREWAVAGGGLFGSILGGQLGMSLGGSLGAFGGPGTALLGAFSGSVGGSIIGADVMSDLVYEVVY